MLLMNAASPEEIGFASSSTQAVENLARAIEDDVKEGEEIIITGEHECVLPFILQTSDTEEI